MEIMNYPFSYIRAKNEAFNTVSDEKAMTIFIAGLVKIWKYSKHFVILYPASCVHREAEIKK